MRFAFTPPEKALLTLLRLHQHTADASSVADGTFALSEPEWGAVYALACRQGVQAVTYDAVKTLPKDILPPKGPLVVQCGHPNYPNESKEGWLPPYNL